MTYLWIYVVTLSLIYILYFLKNYIRTVILTFKLRGFPSWPLLGSTYLFFHEDVLKKTFSTIEPKTIMKVWVTTIPFILIIEPEDIQILLGSSKHINKPFLYNLFRSFFGNGLISKEYDIWKYHRKIIQPAFNNNNLERFTEVFAKYAEYLVLEFSDRLNQDLNITKLVNNIIYNIQSESMLGLNTRKNYTEEEENSLPFKKNQMSAPYRLLRPWLLIDQIYKMTNTSKIDSKQMEDHASLVKQILKETRESMHTNSYDIECDKNEEKDTRTKKRVSFMEYMIEIKGKYQHYGDKEIIDECCTFMLAGMESVSTTVATTLFLLATNKEWQEKCVNELNEIFNDEDTTSISMKTLKEMKCLEMCIKETLRLYPSIPLISRCLDEDEKLGGYTVPAGTKIFISPYLTHRLPHYYPDPEAFKPERFDPTISTEKLNPYVYIPFSAGPRNCVGYKFAMLEIKTLVSTILRNFVLEPVEGKDAIHMKYRMTLRAHGGLWIRFKTRTKTK